MHSITQQRMHFLASKLILGLATSAGLALLFAGCSSTAGEDDATGSSSDAVSSDGVCSGESAEATFLGIPAYGNCGVASAVYSNDGVHTSKTKKSSSWLETDKSGGYQCAEFANRFEHFKYGTSTTWGIQAAADMCATHPSGFEVSHSDPHVGDLMVFGKNQCGHGSAGHVAVVKSVSGNTVTIVQQNTSQATETVTAFSSGHTCGGCYLHATANSTACASKGNYKYCGNTPDFQRGNSGTLHRCDEHQVTERRVCAGGCIVVEGGSDYCKPPKGIQGEPVDTDDPSTDDADDGA